MMLVNGFFFSLMVVWITAAPNPEVNVKVDIDVNQGSHGSGVVFTECGETTTSCKELGGKCQGKADNCDGELLTCQQYCGKSKKCGCCVPEGPVTRRLARTPCKVCPKTEDPCKAIGGVCQKKDAECKGHMIKGDKYCKPTMDCTCCFPKDTACVAKDKFKKDHVCEDCPNTKTPLDFTKVARGNPTYTVPANTVFASNSIRYVYGVYIFDSDGTTRNELSCDMADFVPTYYCCRDVKGFWKDCTGPANCMAKTRDRNGHLLEDTFNCQK